MKNLEEASRGVGAKIAIFARYAAVSIVGLTALLVGLTPANEAGYDPIKFALTDSEYGLNSSARLAEYENRKQAERILAAIESGQPVATLLNVNIDVEALGLGAADIPYSEAEFGNKTAGSEQSQTVVQLAKAAKKAPKPYKMNEYDFDPELMSVECRADFEYLTSTCDRNNNGRVDDDLTLETKCVAYSVRQAVKCEQSVCEAKRDKQQRSIAKWGFFVMLLGILLALTVVMAPIGAVLFVAGFAFMMFSISPLMTWFFAFQCT
jgi:hypothetical protein